MACFRGCFVKIDDSRVLASAGFAAKAGGVIDSVGLRSVLKAKQDPLLFKEASGSRRYRSGY